MTPEQQEQISDNNNFSLLVIFAHQSQIWAEAMKLTKSFKQGFDNNLRNKVTDLAIKAREFNVAVTRQLKSKEYHHNTTAAISKFIEVLAGATEERGQKLVECLLYFEKKSDVVFPNDKPSEELMEKLTIISAMNDKLIEWDLKALQKLGKQVVNTPIKTK